MHSDTYTIGYAAGITILVAVLLALAATALKPAQDANIALEKKKNILMSVGYEGTNYDKDYDSYITSEVVDIEGNVVAGVDAFDIDPKKEAKRSEAERLLPVFIYSSSEGKYYIFPVTGKGLWGSIWGYIALNDDLETIKGTVYDHKLETPGLGAEITKEWFQQAFEGKKIFNENGDLESIHVKKGRGNKLDDYSVDGISGATITSKGVDKMLIKYLGYYMPYFKNKKNS